MSQRKIRSSSMVSVIIPARNVADTIAAQLSSLGVQDYDGEWEIIVVDNGSIDATADVVRLYQQRIKQLRLIIAVNQSGPSYARNVGVRVARGERLMFCDADDIVAPGWLAAFAEALLDHDIVAGGLETELLNRYAPLRPPPLQGSTRRTLNYLPFVSSSNMGLSRRAFEIVGGFCEDMPRGQDIDISWRLQLCGYRIYDVPQAVVHYRYRERRWTMVRQMIRAAHAHARLYHRYAAKGMPRASVKAALRDYLYLIYQFLALGRARLLGTLTQQQENHLDYCLQRAATRIGRLYGSFQYRVLYL